MEKSILNKTLRWIQTTTIIITSVSLSTVSCGDGGKMINTPFGKYPKECVHKHPSGSAIAETDKGIKVSLPSGKHKIIPFNKKCAEHHNRIRKRPTTILKAVSKIPPITWVWFNYAAWTAPKAVASFTSTYTVPATPTNVSNQTLFYFIGIQNNSTPPVTILQPVLGFENQRWHISSWNCCINGHVNFSPFEYGMKPGDKISAIILQDKTNPSKYTITTGWGPQVTTLITYVGVGKIYNWVNATLEVYTINTCKEFSSGVMLFDNVKILDANGNSMNPTWSLYPPPNGKTECNGSISVNGKAITIQENQ